MLEATCLRKTYAGVPAVAGVSFTIGAGEILGYLGPNGSGKSTTVKMLAGLIEPTSGDVRFDGQPIQQDLAGYKRRLGYVPEEPNLYGYLTGTEYLEMVGTLRGLDDSLVTRKANSLLDLFLLGPHRHSPMSSYSKGMRQKVLISAALLHNPELLIFDEPLSGLDVTSVLIFRKLVSLLAAEKKVIFYCSHVLEVVEKVCSHVLILRKGERVAYGPVQDIIASAQFHSLEDTFSQLAAEVDAERTAASMIDVVASR